VGCHGWPSNDAFYKCTAPHPSSPEPTMPDETSSRDHITEPAPALLTITEPARGGPFRDTDRSEDL
jgi:hypothetical protein